MKKVLCVVIVAMFLLSACRKDQGEFSNGVLPDIPSSYVNSARTYLQQHPAFVRYSDVDFSQYTQSKQKANWYLRVAIKNKSLATDFIVLQTDSLGNIHDGKLVHLEKAVTEKTAGAEMDFNGFISIYSVDGRSSRFVIRNGYFDRGVRTAREESFPVPKVDELPEVIVVGYITRAGGGISIGNYMQLQSLFNSYGTGYNDGTGPNAVTGGSTVYSYLGGGGWQPVQNQATAVPDMIVSPETSYLRPPIDINAWTKCFSDLPDAGAVFSLTLFGDLPVDTDPTKGINLWDGNTGHCFMQLTKTTGDQTVTQVIGFTAESPMSAITNTDAFVPGKLVDNAGHKYDCSITMNLRADGFLNVINKMKSLSGRMQYSVVNYDCLDYALDVFNSVRPGNPVRIDKTYSVSDPFSNIANGPKLYTLLEDMFMSGSPEAANITIGGPRYVGESHGPCN